jgi:hypothetical protein
MARKQQQREEEETHQNNNIKMLQTPQEQLTEWQRNNPDPNRKEHEMHKEDN